MPALPSPPHPNADLTTRLGPRLTLPTPVVAASGTFGYGEELADLVDIAQLGALITPTLTLNPRIGNPPPRTSEASAGLLHAIGLPNPGLETFLAATVPAMRRLPCPIIINMLGESEDEWSALSEAISASGIATALELNLSPLALQLAELSHQDPPTEAEMLAHIAVAVHAARRACALPILAKLPGGLDVGRAARVALEAGADVISVAASFPGIAVRLGNRAFRFPGVVGGLSGPCIKPLALYQVWRVAQATRAPLLGMGGIMTAEDALEFLFAGASAVAIGTANLISPMAAIRITADIANYMRHHKLTDVAELRVVA